MDKQKVGIYVDGFNLFYGALKIPERKKYRWLNLEKLVIEVCSSYLSQIDYSIECVKFFTARIKPRKENDDSPKSQQIYFNALKSISNFELILGKFLVHQKFAVICPIEKDEDGNVKKQLIEHTEEKGSDVNLASHFLIDAFKDKIDIAIVITNDTDLVLPLKIVSEDLKKKVIVLSPFKNVAHSIKNLKNIVNYTIETTHLAASQFPDHFGVDCKPVIRPEDWK